MPAEDFNPQDFPGVAAAMGADKMRRGRDAPRPYATKSFVYWVDDKGAIYWGLRHSDNAVVQYSRRTGASSMHPDLEAEGYMLISDACADANELRRMHKHMAAHQAAQDRGRKDRLRFSPPLEDLPTLCLERQIASGHLGGEGSARLAEARKILESRQPAKGPEADQEQDGKPAKGKGDRAAKD